MDFIGGFVGIEVLDNEYITPHIGWAVWNIYLIFAILIFIFNINSVVLCWSSKFMNIIFIFISIFLFLNII